MALKSGWAAALNAWRGDTSETIQTRRARYDVLWGFYLNDIYDEAVNDMAAVYKKQRELYAKIKPLYNPVTRLVDFYVAKVAGGTLDPTGESGALPIEDADPATVEAILQIWGWSNWGRKKGLWVRYGASLGDSVLKVVEDGEQVMIQVHWPGDLVDVNFDRGGLVTYAALEYAAQERNEKHEIVKYTYREEITPESFATFKDGKPFDYGEDGAEWANPYAFVPVVVTRHKESGQNWGLCCFHHVIPKVDDLNDLASHLGSQVRTAIHPQWVSFGTRAGSGLERSDKIWHNPNPDGRIEALVETIDIAAVTGDIASRLRELEQDCPELKVYHMAGQEWSGRAVKLLLGDVIDRVVEARGQYDAALVEADRMALRIGALRGYWPGSLEDEFEHRIGDREIFPTDEAETLGLATQRLGLAAQQALMTGG
jgi:hypothetical protein